MFIKSPTKDAKEEKKDKKPKKKSSLLGLGDDQSDISKISKKRKVSATPTLTKHKTLDVSSSKLILKEEKKSAEKRKTSAFGG